MTPGLSLTPSHATGRRVAVVVAAAVLYLVPGASGQEPAGAGALSAGFRKAAQKVLPAVVTVRAVGGAPRPLRPFRDGFPFAPPPGLDLPVPPEAGGSGVVIDADKGFVITNDHVVNGASRVVVILHNGRERPVSQIRRDPKSDLALLVIDAKGLTQAEWGDSSALETGDWVLAIGQPFGLSDTVTAGIVSGKGRGIGMAMYEDLIQTDAAINPGNSGGPLVNLKGEVVGVNTALKSTRGGFEGVGFAVPASRARRVAADLAQHGAVRRAYLGVAIGPVDPAAAERLENPGAVAVNGVSPGSPAERAGVKSGDVIISLQGQRVEGLGALQSAIEFAAVGEPLSVTVDRDGKSVDLKITPETQPERYGLPGAGPARPGVPRDRDSDRDKEPAPGEGRREARRPAAQERFPAYGMTLSEPGPAVARRFRLRDEDRGPVVVGVDRDGPADASGVEAGMVVTDIDHKRVDSLDDARAALKAHDPAKGLLLRVIRDGRRAFRVIVGTQTDGATPGGEPDRTKPQPEESDDR